MSNDLLESKQDPWWAKHPSKVVLLAFVLMLLSVMGIIPSPVMSNLEAIREEHRGISNILRIQCVHSAINAKERRECLLVRLDDLP
jgi:hypothetical protein